MYFFLKEPKADKLTPIYLIYYVKSDKKNFKYSTGQKIHPNEWNPQSRLPKVKRGQSNNHHITRVLDNYSQLLEDTIKETEKENDKLLKSHLKEVFDNHFKGVKKVEQTGLLADTVNEFVESKKKSKGVSITWVHKYENLRNKLLMFDIHKNVTQGFDVVNEDWLDEYSGFLRELPTHLKNKTYLKRVKQLQYQIRLPKEPYNDNTLYRHINFLFTYLKWSKGKYHNLGDLKNPIRKYKSDMVYHDEEELNILHNLVLPRESLTKVRDVYLIGCYSGQRYGDYSIFENADVRDGMIVNRQQKTRKTTYIPLHSRLKELLDKYDWDLPQLSPQKFREHLKLVCKIAGFDTIHKKTTYTNNKAVTTYHPKYELIGTHTAKRTFVNESIRRRMTIKTVADICGTTIATLTNAYLITSEDEIRRETFNAWDS